MKIIIFSLSFLFISGTLAATGEFPLSLLNAQGNTVKENSANIDGISNRIPVKLNGKDFIYLPDLTLSKSLPAPSNSQAQSLSAIAVTEKNYGTFNNQYVVKKSATVTTQAAVRGNNLMLESNDGYILYDQRWNKFEVTSGNMVFELKPEQSLESVTGDYAIGKVSKVGRQYIISPAPGKDFIELYNAISKDNRLEYVRLLMIPPLKTPK